MFKTWARFLMIGILAVPFLQGQEPVKAGEDAPNFFLRFHSGESFYLSRTVGVKARDELRKPLVLSFFATWCIPCKKEIPQLEILREKYPDVGIYLIDVNEPADLLAEYIAEYDIKLEVLMDRYGKVAAKYGVVSDQGVGNLPTLFIIGDDGKVILSHVGYKEGDEEEYDEVLSKIATEKVTSD